MPFKSPEQRREWERCYRSKNRAKINLAARSACKRWKSKNPEKVRADNRARYHKRKNDPAYLEYHRDYSRRWKKTSRGREVRIADRERRAGKIRAGVIDDLLIVQRGKCRICPALLSEGYHVDHIRPLVKGGTNEDANLQLLCPHCNTSKGTKIIPGLGPVLLG